MTQGRETKVSSFNEIYNKYYNLDGYEHHYEDFYKAGEASRQGEVSELQTEIDELHKKIDLALEKCYTGIRKQGGDYYLELVQDILKGEYTK